MIKYLIFLSFFSCALFAKEELLNLDLDSSWKLIHSQEGERTFKVWEKDDERIVLVSTPWDGKRESIKKGLEAYQAQLPEKSKLTIHEQSKHEAIVEWEIPHEAKALTKLIYTPHSSCIVGRTYCGDKTDSIAINEWITFLKDHVHLDLR